MKTIVFKLLNLISRATNPQRFWRSKGLVLGRECEIYPTASFGSEPYLIRIGDHVRINSGVNFITHDGGCWVLRKYHNTPDCENIDLFGKIVVGNNVHIGTNAFIMPGVSIGDNCIIGCCAVVTSSIPSNSVAVGVPARVIETIDEYYAKHIEDLEYTKGMDLKQKRLYLMKKYGK